MRPTTIGCVALLVGLCSYATSAQAPAVGAGSAQQLDQLRQQVAALERRVKVLEETRAGGVVQSEAPAQARGPQGTKPGVAKPGAEEPLSPQTTAVRAPFVVQDADGHTIFKVDVVPSDKRALVQIGDPKGARVHLGPNALGGSTIGLYDKSSTPGVYLVNTPSRNYVSVVKGERASTILADDTISSAVVYNAKGIPTGTMQAGETGAGRLKISNANGDVRIDAGITADDVGWVRADGPGGGGLSSTPGVAHSWIRGLKK